MFRLKNIQGAQYSPLYFLSALGAGGISVSFFMYLMFMTPHKATPIPTWETLQAVFNSNELMLKILAIVALTGIVIFALMHIRLLIWNIREFGQFKQTSAYEQLKQTNSEVQLMAVPLTYAMTINVSFILGALFVPKLWTVVEYLFPLSILAFAVVGIYAFRILTDYMGRVLVATRFDCARNNNLSQMLSIFALGMIGVGFSAAAAMSTVKLTSGIAMLLSILFLASAAVLALIQLILGFRSMLQNGIDRESSVSLWIVIPIITVVGIALYRLTMGMHHNFDLHTADIKALALFATLMSVQTLFAILGFKVMQRLGYFAEYLYGSGKSVGSFALICPGVATFVMSFFFIHKGLIDNGLVVKNSVVYFLLLVPLVILQIQTIWALLRLNKKLLKDSPADTSIKPTQTYPTMVLTH